MDFAEKLVNEAIKVGFEEAAIIVHAGQSTMVKIANSQPSVIQYWNTKTVNAYLVKDKKIFGVTVQPKEIEDARKVFEDIVKLAEKVKPSPFYAPLPEPQKIEKLEGTVDKSILEALKEPSELTEAIIEAAHREKIDSIAGMIEFSYRERVLANSKGARLYEDGTSVEAYVRAFAGKGSGQWSVGSRCLSKNKVEEMAEIAAHYAVEARNPEEAEAGVYDIILSPMVAGNLFNCVASMASAFSVIMGMSFFMKHKPGDKVASEKFTLIDDARNPELPGSTAFDDEAQSTYSKPIIENGVLKTFLHNTKTAMKMKAKTTANAGLIRPHSWALNIPVGELTLEELIGEVKKGLLVTNNWYTRLQNYVEGTFSTITRDAFFLIENGKIVKPLKKLRIADKFPSLLQNISELGRKAYDIKWWEVNIATRLPYVLVRNVHTSKHTA